MGVAAYNRGSALIRSQADTRQRPVEFEIIERLNAIPKVREAKTPFTPIHFTTDHHGVWALCPRTGFGFCYRTLSQAVSYWQVMITSYAHGVWIGIP